jgi:hypothetical protein
MRSKEGATENKKSTYATFTNGLPNGEDSTDILWEISVTDRWNRYILVVKAVTFTKFCKRLNEAL